MCRVFKGILIVFFYCLTTHGFSEQLSQLKKVQIEKTAQGIEIVYQGSGIALPSTFFLEHPDRLVIDFKTPVFKGTVLGDIQAVDRVRVGHPLPGVTRFVFELKQQQQFQWLEKTQDHGRCRLFSEHKMHASQPRVAVNHKRYRDIMVVIDPGHGGHDPGALGQKGYREKNITLGIATALRQKIAAHPGMSAVLTRSGDHYVGLRERLKWARKHNPDIFISIHADAFIRPESHGASVFALSERGATSEAARWLAEKENYSELGGINLKQLDDHNGMIRSVLVDLSQTATITGSLQLGSEVLKQLATVTQLHHRRVEQARFVVLKSLDIPSILIETGFISNPKEAERLSTPQYQQHMAEAIFKGLNRYFWDHPPHGTALESMAMRERAQ